MPVQKCNNFHDPDRSVRPERLHLVARTAAFFPTAPRRAAGCSPASRPYGGAPSLGKVHGLRPRANESGRGRAGRTPPARGSVGVSAAGIRTHICHPGTAGTPARAVTRVQNRQYRRPSRTSGTSAWTAGVQIALRESESHSGSPIEHSGSPIQHSGSPIQHSASPINTLRVQFNAPRVRFTLCESDSHSGSPIQHSASPIQHSASPIHTLGGQFNAPRVRFTLCESDSHSTSPIQHSKSPIQHSERLAVSMSSVSLW